jgi:glucose-6-phosphate 1-epimerase
MSISLVEYGQLAALRIRADDGAEAIVTLYGAHLVSWTGADGKERLFCSDLSAMDGSRAIRGGVPVIFPQFAERGDGMRHGFARISTWRQGANAGRSADGGAHASFVLESGDLAAPLAQSWPHKFALELNVAVHANELRLTLDVRNRGKTGLRFAAALHSYLAVDDLEKVTIDGVEPGTLTLADKLDKVYPNVQGAITLRDGKGALTLEQSGFTDAVVWNPGAVDAAALTDMDDGEYRKFVCIEPALVDPIVLTGGAVWRGTHHITANG